MTGFTFEAYNLTDGSYLVPLVDVYGVNASFEYSALGSLKFKLPKNGRYYSTFFNACTTTGVEIVTLYNGAEVDDGRFLVQGIEGAVVDEDAPDTSFSGPSIVDLLRKVILYVDTTFTSKTAGEIIKTLMTTAASRGAFGATALSTSTFSNATDSNGVAWGTNYTITFNRGTTYRAILEALVERGAVDFRLTGRSLKLYKGTTLGTSRPDVVVASVNGLAETPFKFVLQDQVNVVLVEGDEGVAVERTVAGARREEAYIQQSGTKDTGTLSVYGDSALVGASVVTEQRTAKFVPGARVQPIRDFLVGDQVLYHVDDGVVPEMMRVRQIVANIDEHGQDSFSVVLNDKILEGEIRRAIALGSLAGGVDGGSLGTPTDPPVSDTTIPSAPTSLTASSTAYLGADGTPLAVVTANWSAVTTNVDTSTITDLAGYRLYVRSQDDGTSPFEFLGQTTGVGTTVSAGGVPANVFRRFVVRAYDQSGNESANSNEFRFQTAVDTTAPNTPSTPTVTPYLGQLRIFWNGLDSGGGAPPIDFDRVEVHISSTSGFTPSSATLLDNLRQSGYAIATDLPYGTTHYVRFIAVDKAGNKSAASTQASAIPETVTGLDIAALTIATTNMADLAISTAKIADAAIINAKIANLAVDDAKIGSVSAGKLTVGTLTADITVSARIKTANTGARVELNSSGLQAFNAAGTQTVDIAASTGNVTILGNFKTGIAGGASPYMTIDDGADRTTISFWNAAGTKNAYINSPAGATTPQIGINTGAYTITGTTSGYGRLFIREAGSLSLETVRGSDQTAYGAQLLLNPNPAVTSGIYINSLGGVKDGGGLDINNGGIALTYYTAGAFTGSRIIVGSSAVDIIGKQTAGTPTGGKIRVDNNSAFFEYNLSGSGQHGLQAYSAGVVTYGKFNSDPSWTAVDGADWSVTFFRLDKWGPFAVLHCQATRNNTALTAGNFADNTVCTISTTGGELPGYTSNNVPINAVNSAGSGGAVLNPSTGALVITSFSAAISIGNAMIFGGVWYVGVP